MKTRSRTIIVSAGDEAMLDDIAAAHPLVSRHRIAQAALRLGLRTIAAAPERLVDAARQLTPEAHPA